MIEREILQSPVWQIGWAEHIVLRKSTHFIVAIPHLRHSCSSSSPFLPRPLLEKLILKWFLFGVLFPRSCCISQFRLVFCSAAAPRDEHTCEKALFSMFLHGDIKTKASNAEWNKANGDGKKVLCSFLCDDEWHGFYAKYFLIRFCCALESGRREREKEIVLTRQTAILACMNRCEKI